MARRFGVAIGLPEPYTSQLKTWRERLGDPQAECIPPHVTLLPPTNLPAGRLPEVEEHLRQVAAAGRRFAIALAGTDSFRPTSPVVFVPLVAGATECARVQELVRSGPLARAVDFPYHPHVTVAHDLDDDRLDRASTVLTDYEARFTAWGFTLFEYGRDGMWRPQRDFSFGLGGLPGPAEPPNGRVSAVAAG